MRSTLCKLSGIGFLASGLLLLTPSAQADPALPGLTNLNFLSYTGSAPKNTFQAVNPTGWTGGSGLIYIDNPEHFSYRSGLGVRPNLPPNVRLSQQPGNSRWLQRGGGGWQSTILRAGSTITLLA